MRIDSDELRAILEKGEGRQVEFKRGLPRPEKTARSLCAFANTRGGWLVIGVNDDGSLHGVPDPRQVIAELREIGRRGIEPPLDAQVASVELDEVRIVVCSVPLSGARPHSVLRREDEPEIVVRVGASNRRADGATLDAMRRPRRGKKGLDALERRVIDWVGRARPKRGADPGTTVKAFAQAHNVGLQRAKRAFTRLERDGHLVGHGFGARRVFSLG